MSDDTIRERHGVSNGGCHWVNVRETNDGGRIIVAVYDSTVAKETTITPAEARYIAGKLKRLADRADRRTT